MSKHMQLLIFVATSDLLIMDCLHELGLLVAAAKLHTD